MQSSRGAVCSATHCDAMVAKLTTRTRRRGPLGRFPALIMALVAAVALLTSALPARADTPLLYGEHTWSVNGRVAAILPIGDRVYVGGYFTAVVDPSGNSYPASNLAVYIPSQGGFDTSWAATTDGPVLSLADQRDTLYVGGDFDHVNGIARSNLAAVSADNGTLQSWAARTNNVVNALLSDGDIYVGGNFTSLGDASGMYSIGYLGRVAATTGAVETGWLPRPSAQVRALAASADGSAIFAGGDFTVLAGRSSAGHLASVDAVTGALRWAASPYYGINKTRPPAYSLAVDGNSLLVGAGGAGGTCASLNAASGAVNWTLHTNGDVQTVGAVAGVVYCGGHFDGATSFNGLPRSKLAAVDESSGTVLSFAPSINSALGVFASATDTVSGAVYIGGDFTKVGLSGSWGVQQPHLLTLVSPDGRTAPSSPPTMARGGDGVVRLFWQDSWTNGGASIYSYRIFRALPGKPMTKVGSTPLMAWQDTNVVNGTTYQYSVQAVSSVGASALSPAVSATPNAEQYQAPTQPQAVAGVSSAAQVALSWSPPVDDGGQPVTGYLILRGSSSGTETLLASVSAAANGYTDAGASLKQTYYYEVIAVNAVGHSDPSSEVTVSVTATPPGAPVVTATPGNGTVTLNWAAPSSGDFPITKYTVVRDKVQYAHLQNVLTYLDTNSPAGTYVYQVRATSAAGNGPLSSPVTVTVTGP